MSKLNQFGRDKLPLVSVLDTELMTCEDDLTHVHHSLYVLSFLLLSKCVSLWSRMFLTDSS